MNKKIFQYFAGFGILGLIGSSTLIVVSINNKNETKISTDEINKEVTTNNINLTKSTILTNEIAKNLGWNQKTSITLHDWELQAPHITKLAGSFWGFGNLLTIEIPKNIEVIGSNSFGGTFSLKSITFEPESSLSALEEFSLDGIGVNTGMDPIVVPKSVKTLGKFSFSNSAITHLSFESGSLLHSIGYDSFWGCDTLESIQIPESTTHIGELAFKNTTKLSDISMPIRFKDLGMEYLGFTQVQWDSINWIYESATHATILTKSIMKSLGWDKKTVITLEDWRLYAPKVVELSVDVFKDNTILTSIELPNSIQKIGNLAFSGTTFLEDINFNIKFSTSTSYFGLTQTQWDAIKWVYSKTGATVLTKDIADQLGWTSKETITLDDWEQAPNVEAIGPEIWKNNKFIKSISIPEGVKMLDNGLFESSTLKSIYFTQDSKLHTISTGVFNGTQIKKIEVPLSVEVVEYNSFESTLLLNDISMHLKHKTSDYEVYGFTEAQYLKINWINDSKIFSNSSNKGIIMGSILLASLVPPLGVFAYAVKKLKK